MRFIDVLHCLADGKFHSGEKLGEDLGVTRTVIWSAIREMREMGVDVQAVNGRGYRILNGINLLKEENINSHHPFTIEVFPRIPSTNQYLFEKLDHENHTGRVCIAEQQTNGRGRRGRIWQSPFASNIYLSLIWRFQTGSSMLSGLSLAIALAVVETLKTFAIDEVAVKWPNDVFVQQKKIAGILLEVKGDAVGPCDVVIGVGLNVNTPLKSVEIDQPWTTMQKSSGKAYDRNQVVSELLKHMHQAIESYQQQGFSAMQQQWRQYDMLDRQQVTLSCPQGDLTGEVKGVDEQGCLLMQIGEKLLHLPGGEVSLRRTVDVTT